MEGVIVTSRYISQACLIGDRRNFITALITVEMEQIREYAKINNIKFEENMDLIKHPKIISMLDSQIDEKNESLAPWERVKKYTIVPEYTIDNSLLTPTQKIKRRKIEEKYFNEIERMYRKT